MEKIKQELIEFIKDNTFTAEIIGSLEMVESKKVLKKIEEIFKKH